MEAAGGGRRSGERQPEEVWRWCKLLKESLQSNSSCSVPHGLLAGTRVGADGCGKWSLSSVAPPPSFNQEKLTVYLLISNKRPCLSSRPQVEVSLLSSAGVKSGRGAVALTTGPPQYARTEERAAHSPAPLSLRAAVGVVTIQSVGHLSA